MASIIESIAEIKVQSNKIAETFNTSLGEKDLGTIISDYFDNIPTLHIPDNDEWKKFFQEYEERVFDALFDPLDALDEEIFDTITTNYRKLSDAYKEWKDHLVSYIGAESFDDIYNNYNNALLISEERNKKFIINNNEFERVSSGINNEYVKDIKVKDTILKTNEVLEAARTSNKRNRGKKINEFLNKSVGGLILSGPDLQKNMFDVFLVYHSGEDGGETDNTKFVLFCAPTENPIAKNPDSSAVSVTVNPNATLTSLIEDVYMLSVRTQSVEVPLRTINTGNWSWIGAKVDIPQSDWDFKTSSYLTVDLDANLYVYDIFNALSGFVRPGTYGSGHYYENSQDRPKEDNNFYNVLSPGKVGFEKHTIDLYVPIHKLSNYVYGGVDYTSKSADILYIFEDIRFLGVGDTIKFSSSSSGVQSINVPFIFKNIRTVYRTDRAEIQESTDLVAFDKELQKFIFDHAGDSEGLIGG